MSDEDYFCDDGDGYEYEEESEDEDQHQDENMVQTDANNDVLVNKVDQKMWSLEIMENLYYKAKQSNDESVITGALKLEKRNEKYSEWGFKLLKRLTKHAMYIETASSINNATIIKVESRFNDLMTYFENKVKGKADMEKSLTSLLDYIGKRSIVLADELGNNYEEDMGDESSLHVKDQLPGLQVVLYKRLLETIESGDHGLYMDKASWLNSRLWFRAKTRIANYLLQSRDYSNLKPVLCKLKQMCISNDDDLRDVLEEKKCALLLEVLSIEMQMLIDINDYANVQEDYNIVLNIIKKISITHPQTLGLIYECAAKMSLCFENNMGKAFTLFLDAFKQYDEAGMINMRIRCLNYVILTNMLSNSKLSPFDTQEAKPYRDDPHLKPMQDLLLSYQQCDVYSFQENLKSNEQYYKEDDFIYSSLTQLTITFQKKILLSLLFLYDKLQLSFLACKMNLDVLEVEKLLMDMITNEELNGKIDSIQGCLKMAPKIDKGQDRFITALQLLADAITVNNVANNSNNTYDEYPIPSNYQSHKIHFNTRPWNGY